MSIFKGVRRAQSDKIGRDISAVVMFTDEKLHVHVRTLVSLSRPTASS